MGCRRKVIHTIWVGLVGSIQWLLPFLGLRRRIFNWDFQLVLREHCEDPYPVFYFAKFVLDLLDNYMTIFQHGLPIFEMVLQ